MQLVNGAKFLNVTCFFFFCLSCSFICSCTSNCYSSLEKCIPITTDTDTLLQYLSLELDLTTCIACATCIIIYLNLVFCSEVHTPSSLYIYNYNNQSSAIMCCLICISIKELLEATFVISFAI